MFQLLYRFYQLKRMKMQGWDQAADGTGTEEPAPDSKHIPPSGRKLPRQGDSGKGEFLASDVGPILRQSLTRAEGFFNNLLSLTLFEKLIRGQVPE